jgi:hypothetical protein
VTVYFFFFLISTITPQTQVNPENFYLVFSSDNYNQIEKMISNLQQSQSSSTRNAYLGAILMKHAQFEKNAKKRIKIFKQGEALLETEIQNNTSNVEYHFLRFVIQENAPKILKYRSNLESDKLLILKNYKQLPPRLRNVIKKYAEQSERLTINELIH